MKQAGHFIESIAQSLIQTAFIAMATYFVFSLFSAAHAASILDVLFNNAFTCVSGAPVGSMFATAPCTGDPAAGQVFSSFVCEFEKVMQDVMAQVYCRLAFEAQVPVTAALTLLISIYGAAFLMGATPFTAKELMIFAAKFTLVSAFALNSDYMIGIGYQLFMGFSREGILVVLDNLFYDETGASILFGSVEDIYACFDTMIGQIIDLTAKDETETTVEKCGNALFALTVLMLVVLPPIFFIGVYLMVKIVWVLLRAIFGYCQGILGVTFLVALAPIFVSFALFKPTRALFDKWIQYLISFSFQMVIVFAFLGMVFSLASIINQDMKDFTELVRPYNESFQEAGLAFPWKVCGICELNPIDPNDPFAKPSCTGSGKVLHPSELIKNQEFMNIIMVKVIAMIVLFYVIDVMMDQVPGIARMLAGPKYAGQLGGGYNESNYAAKEIAPSDLSVPGERFIDNATSGFIQGFKGAAHTPGAVVSGFMAAGERMVLGSAVRQDGTKEHEGLIDSVAPMMAFGALMAGGRQALASKLESATVARPEHHGGGEGGQAHGGGAPSEKAAHSIEGASRARADTIDRSIIASSLRNASNVVKSLSNAGDNLANQGMDDALNEDEIVRVIETSMNGYSPEDRKAAIEELLSDASLDEKIRRILESYLQR